MTTTEYKHITLDANGTARIDGTRMKVVHLLKQMMAGSRTPDQLHEDYPHLSLSQILAALAYYYDHKAQVDAEVRRDLAEGQALLSQLPEPPARQKLRDLGMRP